MATETELKLTLSPQAACCLPEHPRLVGLAPRQRRLLNTYYDTPALLLKKQRVALRFRKIGQEWLLTVKSAEPSAGGLAQRSEWEYPAVPGVFDFSPVDAPELRAQLEAAKPFLVPLFTTHFQRSAWVITDGHAQIEVALDRGWVASQGRRSPLCEVELELLTGQVEDLFSFARILQEQIHLHPAVISKAERGYALFADQAPAPCKSSLPPITAAMSPVAAFRSIALSCLEHLQRNEAGILEGEEPEFVHQARVALRRLRSTIKLFAPLLPPSFVSTYSEAWRDLATSLGAARNWDVFITETLPAIHATFPDDAGVRRLQREGRRRARRAHATAATLLAQPDYSRLLTDFTAALLVLPENSTQTLADLARQRLKRRARQVQSLVRRHRELNAVERHQMRIRFKKLRYALDFFSPLLPRRHLKPYLASVAKLQNELGLINDHVTAQALVTEVLGENRSGTVQGWIAGRHVLLVARLPKVLEHWPAHKAPWKEI